MYSLTEKAYVLIKKEIITCSLLPGEQISQAQFVEKLGIGLSPVRSALQMLVQEGFLNPIPRFGFFVSIITLPDVQELFELRQVLEVTAARLAVERGSDEMIKEIAKEANFTYIYKNRDSYTEFLDRNENFHRSIAELSGNNRLVEAVMKVFGELKRVFHLGLNLRDSADEMKEEHLELSKALLARDPDQAEAIIRSQVLRSKDRVIEVLVSGVLSGNSKQLSHSISLSKLPPPKAVALEQCAWKARCVAN